jgi:hypothetical protein
MKIVFIADAFIEDILGGGEICNECVINNYKNNNVEVIKLHSYKSNLETIKSLKNSFFIIGNFIGLKTDVLEYITNNLNYIIYEHDYKFLKSRNPAKYFNFIAPYEEIVYYNFYKNAKKVFCQSEFQKQIIYNNLKIENLFSLGTNFWLEQHYNLMEQISTITKKQKYAIIDYNIDHKNTFGSIQYCINNKLEYEIIKDSNYDSFIKKLGQYKGFIFLPKTPETFSRTCLEAKMMNLELKINNLIGASKETWFKEYKGIELIKHTKELNQRAYKLFMELA